MQIRSVTEVTQYIKALLDADASLADLWVEGEISNYTRAASGHCYFTLKDVQCELRCVMWRQQALLLRWTPQQGEAVAAHGYISVYERGGAYQFYVDILQRSGIGARWQAFEALKARLAEEGLFDAERKRPLPRWPRCIGVVTSSSGAALRDILNVLQARYPLVEVLLSPSLVQGEEAPDEIVRAIQRLNERDDVDVVIVARGGGSLEDLWAFNDERVARAIAACRAPVVSGVGHETDFTIADFVADLRAPTPSAAAAAVVPDAHELRARVREMEETLLAQARARLGDLRELLEREERALRAYSPLRKLAEHRQAVDELSQRLAALVRQRLCLLGERLQAARQRLQALGPRAVVQRGYALVEDKLTGMRIRSTRQTRPGLEIVVHLSDGQLEALVGKVQ